MIELLFPIDQAFFQQFRELAGYMKYIGLFKFPPVKRWLSLISELKSVDTTFFPSLLYGFVPPLLRDDIPNRPYPVKFFTANL